MAFGKVIKLFLVDGTPNGRWICELSNWTGIAYKIPRSKIKESPILLLDDVLSELDRNRQNYLLENITDLQTMITCTGLEEFIGDRKRYHTFFHVVNGRVFLEEKR